MLDPKPRKAQSCQRALDKKFQLLKKQSQEVLFNWLKKYVEKQPTMLIVHVIPSKENVGRRTCNKQTPLLVVPLEVRASLSKTIGYAMSAPHNHLQTASAPYQN